MEYSKIPTTGKFANAASVIDDNFNKTSIEVEKLKNSTTRNKGYFSSESALKSAYPTALDGDIAYVGNNYPYQIWKWDIDINNWKDTLQTGGDESVNLGDYYTKSEIDNRFLTIKSTEEIII